MKYISMDDWKDSFTTIAERGDEIAPEIYEEMLGVVPPIGLKGGQGVFAGFQLGEPHKHAIDKEGNFKAQYMTFVKRGDRYFYEGIIFAGYVDICDMEACIDDEDMEL